MLFSSEGSWINLVTDLFVMYATFFSSAYIFFKANRFFRKKTLIWVIIGGVALLPLSEILMKYSYEMAKLYELLISIAILLLSCKKRTISLMVLSFVSIGLVHGLKMIAIILGITVFWIMDYNTPNIIVYSSICALYIVMTIMFMKIPRFRKGFQFFNNTNNLGIGIAISGLLTVLICMPYGSKDRSGITGALAASSIFGMVMIGFGLYLWIRRSITAHYRERLQLKTEEHYQKLLADSEEKNRQLSKSNEFLAKVVHRDNHIISSLNQSVDAYFQNGDKDFRDDLLREIQTLAKERGELIEAEQRNLKILPSTGSLLIDGAIRDLYIKAAATSIDFDLTVSAPLTEIIGKYISQTDLQTLLCDHIKDAVIAVNANGSICGKILITLSMNNGNYEISIFDNGVEFKTDTLAKLGEERVTTHADSGGSGIGFMTTFETLRKSYASMIITEFENKTPFSKSVTFRFDSATSFIVISYRAEELQRAINRSDVMILPKVI